MRHRDGAHVDNEVLWRADGTSFPAEYWSYPIIKDNEVLGAVWRRLNDSALGPAFGSASTLLGVASLGFTGQLVEVDLTAALPD